MPGVRSFDAEAPEACGAKLIEIIRHNERGRGKSPTNVYIAELANLNALITLFTMPARPGVFQMAPR